MTRAHQKVIRVINVRREMESIKVVINKVRGVIRTLGDTEGVNGGVLTAAADTRSRTRKVGP